MGFLTKLVDVIYQPIPLPSYSKKAETKDLKVNIAPGQSLNTIQPGAKPKSPKTINDVSKIVLDSVPTGKPVTTDWTAGKAISDGMEVHSWVYSCVNIIATAIASVPWEVQKKLSNNEWDKIDNHPVAELLENPNPFYTGVDMIGSLVQHLLLSGNALLLKVRDGTGVVKELWIISPDCIKPIPDENNYLVCYLYKSGKTERLISVDDIIHFKLDNPASRWWGMSPLRAVSKIVDTDVDAIEWWRWSLRNRCVKDGILQFKHPIAGPEFNLLKEQMIAQMTGSYNARIPLIIGSDSTFTPTSMTPVDMDFPNGRVICRNEIAGAFNIPIIILTYAEGASYNNADKAAEQFWTDNVIAKLRKMGATLQKFLLSEFEDTKKFRVNFDLSDVAALQAQFQAKTNIAMQYVTAGVPFNIVNTRFSLGFPEIEGMDMGWLPGTYMPFIGNPDAEELYKPQPPLPPAMPGTGTGKPGGGTNGPKPKKPKTPKPGARPPSNPSGANGPPGGRIGKKGKENQLVLSPYAKQLHLLKNTQDNDRKIELAEKTIVSLFRQEQKMVNAALAIHGEQGIEDALSYSADNWKQLINTLWSYNDFSGSEEVVATKLNHIISTTKEELHYATSKEQVDYAYDKFVSKRAAVIAEDNILSSYNTVDYVKAKTSGKRTKTWLTMHDNLVRESHAEQDGTTLDIDEIFPNGCSFPGDPSAELEETVNCRCSLVYSD